MYFFPAIVQNVQIEAGSIHPSHEAQGIISGGALMGFNSCLCSCRALSTVQMFTPEGRSVYTNAFTCI